MPLIFPECFWFPVNPSRFNFPTLDQSGLLLAVSQDEIITYIRRPACNLQETSSLIFVTIVSHPKQCSSLQTGSALAPLLFSLETPARVLLLKHESKDVFSADYLP